MRSEEDFKLAPDEDCGFLLLLLYAAGADGMMDAWGLVGFTLASIAIIAVAWWLIMPRSRPDNSKQEDEKMYYYNGTGQRYELPEQSLEPPLPRRRRPYDWARDDFGWDFGDDEDLERDELEVEA